MSQVTNDVSNGESGPHSGSAKSSKECPGDYSTSSGTPIKVEIEMLGVSNGVDGKNS